MRKIKSFSIGFLLFALPGLAQVSLTVSTPDAKNSSPLDSALVTLKGLDNSFFGQKYTDMTGMVIFADIVTQIETSRNIPESFAMSLPYPQPVKTGTAVELTIAQNQDINIAVYNILGQSVLNEHFRLTRGQHNATFDLNHLSAGLYVIRVQAGEKTLARKIIKTTAASHRVATPVEVRRITGSSFSVTKATPVHFRKASAFRLTIQKPGYIPLLDSILVTMDTTIVRPLLIDPGGNGQWDSIGPYGIDVSALAVDPLNPDNLLVAASSGNIFSSSDGAATWQLASQRGAWVRTLRYHPADPSVVFAGMDLFSVEKSIDGGFTWTGSGSGLLFDPFIYSIAFHPFNPDTMFVATFRSLGTGGIYKSTDGGSSWSASQSGMTDPFATTVVPDPIRPEILYAGTYQGMHGLYKSSDGGSSWLPMNNGLTDLDVFAIAIDPVYPDTVFCATAGGGVFLSENGGVSWQAINAGILNPDIRALVLHNESPEVLFASGAGGIFKTVNRGQSWSPAGNGITNPLIVKLTLDPANPENIYAGATGASASAAGGSFFGGVFRSADDGENWQFKSTGLLSADVRAIAVHPYNPNLMYAGTAGGGANGHGVLRSTDGGATWNSAMSGINLGLSTPEILDVDINPDHPEHVLAATLSDGIYMSTNGGVNWTQVLDGGQVSDLAHHPRNPNIVLAGVSGGLQISSDTGETWEPSSLNSSTVKILFNPTSPAIIYAGASGAGVYKSIDGGITWTLKSQGIINTLIRCLAIDERNPDILYAGSLRDRTPGNEKPPQIYKTTDGAETWSTASPQEFEAFALLVDPLQPNILYAGTLGAGVRKSTDGGMTWGFINNNLGNTRILALSFHPVDPDIVFGGTVGGGIFRIEF